MQSVINTASAATVRQISHTNTCEFCHMHLHDWKSAQDKHRCAKSVRVRRGRRPAPQPAPTMRWESSLSADTFCLQLFQLWLRINQAGRRSSDDHSALFFKIQSIQELIYLFSDIFLTHTHIEGLFIKPEETFAPVR